MMHVSEGIEKFLGSVQFYELMQVYRHAPTTPQTEVVDAFEAVKSTILSEVVNLEEWRYSPSSW